MSAKWLRPVLRHVSLLGLLLGGALLVTGAASYWVSRQGSIGLLLMTLGGGWVLSWCLDWLLVRQSVVRPLERLATAIETLATEDSLALAGALAKLERGDLTARVVLPVRVAPLPTFSPLNRLAYALNQLSANLQNCAAQFNLMIGEPSEAICFVGPDQYMMGRIAGELMGQALDGQGQVVILVGRHETSQDTLRRRGFETVLREKYPQIQEVSSGETRLQPEVAYTLTQDFIHRYPKLGGIYITEGSSPGDVARAVVHAGMARKVRIVAHDLVDGTMEYVTQGAITVTIGQSPYRQGHDAVVHLYNHLVTGWRPEARQVVIEPDVITPANYREYWQNNGVVAAAGRNAARLAQPMQVPPRPLRIAKVGSDNVFWNPIWAGAEAAAAECHVTLEKIVVAEGYAVSSQMTMLEQVADKAIAGEYDGVVAAGGLPGYVPILNRLAAAGVPFAVVNTEPPASFRGMIALLGEQTQRLTEVSHELRTPLSLVVGLSDMMLTAPQPDATPLPDVYRRDLERIRANAEQLKWLIGDVLDLASSQAGQLRLRKDRLCLGEVAQAAARVGEEMARAKGLHWQAEIPDDLPAVWGDRARLQQAIVNLLANACKFTPVGEVRLAIKEDGAEVLVSVCDTGVGIPPGEQAAIFEEFYKSKRTVEGGYGGLGLGLTITRRLVQMHGGRIWVESVGETGKGSTFKFTLPVLAAAPEAAETGIGEAAGPKTVLLVVEGAEDNQVRQRLARAGWTVESVKMPEHCELGYLEPWLSQALATQTPAAVVLGLAPTSERAWALMRALREHPGTHDVPIVFYTHLAGRAGGEVIELDYLTKPIESHVLREALERHGVAATSSRRTVLIVDDEPGLLDLHQRMVRQSIPGCRVPTAQSGQEALDKIQRERPDIVLLDLMMPGLDGFGVLEAMQAGESTRGIPVVVLTARVLTEEDMTRLNRGVAAVLSKGVFNAEEVSAQITAALERSKQLGGDTQRVVRHAMAYMHEHYAEPISREEIARHVGLHENYLSRCFRQEVGVTPMAYLNRYRVKQAKLLLEDGRSVTEVASAVGFSSSEHFSRVFHLEVGVSPSVYRRGGQRHGVPSE